MEAEPDAQGLQEGDAARDEKLLSQLEEMLRRPDYALEPSVRDTLKAYITAKGKPETAVEHLSENYVGYAQMASMVCKWQQLVEDEEWPSHDEFYYLKEFSKAKYEPEKLVDVFKSGGRVAWLDRLLADARGRALIYELSAVHRNSLLLNFAIQKIMKQGHQDEVASVGSALASYFSVFHKLLANKLTTLLAACTPDGASGSTKAPAALARELDALAKELKDSCASGQHTYAHVQHLLQAVAATHPNGVLLRGLSTRMEMLAAADNAAVWGMAKLVVPGGPGVVKATYHVGHMLAVSGGDVLNAVADLLHLHRLYCDELVEVDDPTPLQHPALLEMLLRALFTPRSVPLSAENQSYCINLLAIATSSRSRGGRSAHADGDGDVDMLADADADVAGPSGHSGPSGRSGRSSGAGRGEGDGYGDDKMAAHHASRSVALKDDPRVISTANTLRAALGVLVGARGGPGPPLDVGILEEVTALPMLCCGVLRFTRAYLTSTESQTENCAPTAFYTYLRFLVAITQRYTATAPAPPPPPAAASASPSTTEVGADRPGGPGAAGSSSSSSSSSGGSDKAIIGAAHELPKAVLQVLEQALAVQGKDNNALTAQILNALTVLLLSPTGHYGPMGDDAAGPDGSDAGSSTAAAAAAAAVQERVMSMLEQWVKEKGSQSQHRHLVYQILAAIAPPYSPSFAAWLLRLIGAAKAQRDHGKREALGAALRDFALAAGALAYEPALATREAQLLAELLAPSAAGRG